MNSEHKEILLDFFEEGNSAVFKATGYTKYGYVFLASGILLSYLSFAGYTVNLILLGIAFVLIGLFLIRKKLTDLFSFGGIEGLNEETIGELFTEDVNKTVLTRALNISGIKKEVVSEENIFFVYVPIYEEIQGIETQNILRKQINDETFIYSVWQIHILTAAKNFISYYSSVYNWIDNEMFNELSNEFYYTDIASIKTDTIEKDCHFLNEEEVSINSVKRFIISNVSGDKIEFISEKPALKLNSDFNNDTEELVKSIRLLLRKKRFPEDAEFSEKEIDFEIEDTRSSDNLS